MNHHTPLSHPFPSSELLPCFANTALDFRNTRPLAPRTTLRHCRERIVETSQAWRRGAENNAPTTVKAAPDEKKRRIFPPFRVRERPAAECSSRQRPLRPTPIDTPRDVNSDVTTGVSVTSPLAPLTLPPAAVYCRQGWARAEQTKRRLKKRTGCERAKANQRSQPPRGAENKLPAVLASDERTTANNNGTALMTADVQRRRAAFKQAALKRGLVQTIVKASKEYRIHRFTS